jgi:uncharacterized protein (UPF0335 family)
MPQMTLEKLAVMVKNGFDDVQNTFVLVFRKFEKIDERFERIETDIGYIKHDVEDIKLRLDSKADRFELKVLEKRFDKHLDEHKKNTR